MDTIKRLSTTKKEHKTNIIDKNRRVYYTSIVTDTTSRLYLFNKMHQIALETRFSKTALADKIRVAPSADGLNIITL